MALPGARREGRSFIGDAAGRGAAAALAEPDKTAYPIPVLRVGNAVEALGRIAAGTRNLLAPHLIGVSGSMGKTTVKEMILVMLKTSFPAWGTRGNWNNQIGLPLSLANMPRGTKEGVFEIGINHPGEMAPLCRLLRPDAAVLTNIGPAHLGNFGSVTALAAEKALLVQSVPSSGFVVLDRDSPWFDFLAEAARGRVVGVSMNPADSNAAFRGRLLDTREGVVEITGTALEEPRVLRSGLPGEHNARNLLQAVAAASLRGVPAGAIEDSLKGLSLPPMRWQKRRIHTVTLVNDAYNANPEGMRRAIDTFAEMPASAHLLALGDMLELGEAGRAEHEKIAEQIAAGPWKRVVLLGESTRWTFQAAVRRGVPREKIFHAENYEQAAELLRDAVEENCAVFFKASRGMRLENVVDRLAGKMLSPGKSAAP